MKCIKLIMKWRKYDNDDNNVIIIMMIIIMK